MSLAALAVLGALASSSALPPPPTRWVEDTAGVMSAPARAEVDAKLEAYQQETGHQVVVWIARGIDGAPLDDFAVRTFKAWGVGRKGADDGLVIFVLTDERKAAIEVGYGLEGVVPDAIAKRVIDDVMIPRFKQGDPDGAIRGGVDAVLTAIEGHPWTPGTAPAIQHPPDEPLSPVEIGFAIIAGVGLLVFAIKHPRAFLWLLAMGVGRWGGWGGGGGGGGGFSGGGGRSGGGGARGDW